MFLKQPETTGIEISARPYTLTFVSEAHFLLGVLHVPRPSHLITCKSKTGQMEGLGRRLIVRYVGISAPQCNQRFDVEAICIV